MKSRSKTPSQARTRVLVNKSTVGRLKVGSTGASKKRSGSLASTVVVRSSVTGRLTVGGTDERRLVNRRSTVSVRPAPSKPKHFSESQIRAMTKRMKVG
jgi:hypothetical protein